MSDFVKYGLTTMTAAAVVVIAAISATAYNSRVKDELMAKDIQTAMEKGVNPMVIRCAYSSEDDRICLIYTATRGDETRVDLKAFK